MSPGRATEEDVGAEPGGGPGRAAGSRILRALASPTRLRILHLLASGPCEVHQIVDALGLSQAATSQHLAALRRRGRRRGDPRRPHRRVPTVPTLSWRAACELLREVLVRRLAHMGDMAANAEETRRDARVSSPRARALSHALTEIRRTPMADNRQAGHPRDARPGQPRNGHDPVRDGLRGAGLRCGGRDGLPG